MSGPIQDEEAEVWSSGCERCGSHFISSTEINDDNPDAMEHVMFYCAQCGDGR